MGRRNTPVDEKEAKGNPGRREIPAEPEIGRASAGEPEWLTGADERAVWSKLRPDLIAARLVRSTDEIVLGRYCTYVAQWIAVKKRLGDRDLSYETDTKHGKMLRIHPDFIIMDRLEDNLIKLEEQIGLTPLARIRMLAQLAGYTAPPAPGELPLRQQEAPAPNAAPSPASEDDDTIGALRRLN